MFGVVGFDGTDTIRTDTVSETTLRDGSGQGATNVDCGFNYDGNVGGEEVGVGGVSTDDISGISQLRSVAICLIAFFVLSPNYREVTVGLGYDSRLMMSPID